MQLWNALAKSYEGASIKEVYSADKETGKIYKVILTTKDSQEVTVLLDEKGEEIKRHNENFECKDHEKSGSL